ncbi:MAG: response regulator [Treponema sp.]|nr:response regulator [Treponema sp.]
MSRHLMGRAEPESERNFFISKKAEVSEYNKSIFLRLSSMTFIIFLLGSSVTFFPTFSKYVTENVFEIRMACICATLYFGAGTFFAIFRRKDLNAHPLIFLYFLFFGLATVCVYLNLKIQLAFPFVMLGVFRILLPVWVLDYKWRMNILTNIYVTVVIFIFSYMFKPLGVFLLDLIVSTACSALGMLVCSFSINHHIDSAKKADDQMNRVREIEKAKNEAKTMFVAHMSHEIRTPVNSILGLNEIILRETNEPKVRELANNISLSGDTLLKIINDILDFSKIEAGKMDIVLSEYEISSMITDLVNIGSQRAKSKNLALVINVDENLPHKLFGDEIRIKQCILNILNNAIKFTDRGSVMLNIGFDKIDNGQIMLKVMVKDTGIGIKETDLGRMCDEFERLDENRNRTIEGSGLGLNIVSTLLRMMDSKLEVSSVYGEGSEFSFKIPQQVVWWERIGNFNSRYSKILTDESAYHVSFKAPDARVLVVDDTKMNIIVFEGLLKETEVKIDSVTSGQEMLEYVKKKRYDTIFIDHRMPGMSGVEAFHAMQTLEGNLNEGVPCVALTANVVSGAREYYLREGFVDYLSKPVDSRLLENMLGRLIPAEKHLNLDVDSTATGKKRSIEDQLSMLDGINLPTAIQNCGSPEILMVALKEYYATIRKRAEDIENYAHQKDFRNYTIQVHALKSSSRLIGALELSEKAAYLEKCGDEENAVAIAAKTPELLKLYRSYAVKLDSLNEKDDSSKPLLELDKFNEAMAAVKEFAGAFDFSAIDNIIEEVEKYSLPEEVRDKFAEVARLSRGADFNGLKEILK